LNIFYNLLNIFCKNREKIFYKWSNNIVKKEEIYLVHKCIECKIIKFFHKFLK